MERHFTEEQVAEIIRRAAIHQACGKTGAEPTSTGVSETELFRVAEELGIDADACRRALAEVDTGFQDDTGSITSVSRVLKRTVEGDFTEDTYGTVLEEFVPTSGLGGQVVLPVGSGLSYTSFVGMAQCSVSVGRRERQTVLRVYSNASHAGLVFFPALIATALSGMLVLDQVSASAGVKAIIWLIISAAVWSGAIVAFRAMVRNINKKVLALVERAAARLASTNRQIEERLARTDEEQAISSDAERPIELG